MTHREDSDDLLDRALKLRDAGAESEAILLLEKNRTTEKQSHRFWQVLGLLHRADEDMAAALESFSRAAELAPFDARIIHGFARVSMEAGLPALELYDRALSLSPNDGDVIIGRSAAQLAAGLINDAIANLTEQCHRNPIWLDGHAALSNLQWLTGNDVGFVSSYAEALASNLRHQPLWLALIDRYMQVERYDWAEAGIQAARKATGGSIELDACSAICASELGAHAVATEIIQKLGPPRNASLAVRWMRHLLRTGNADEAAEIGEKWIGSAEAGQIWPYLATAWRLMGDQRWHWLERQDRLIQVQKIYSSDEMERIVSPIRSLHQGGYPPLGQSVRRGTQTDGPLFSRIDPTIMEIRDRSRNAVADYIAQLPQRDVDHPVLKFASRDIRFSGSWSVRLTGEGHHTNHVHPQGWISSAFYLAVPEEQAAGPAPAGHLSFGLPPTELGISLEPMATVKPEPGSLILFPSTMWHGTLPIKGGERLTIAFDIRPPR
jgi:tetratricopeptide (TPR) repeat protein